MNISRRNFFGLATGAVVSAVAPTKTYAFFGVIIRPRLESAVSFPRVSISHDGRWIASIYTPVAAFTKVMVNEKRVDAMKIFKDIIPGYPTYEELRVEADLKSGDEIHVKFDRKIDEGEHGGIIAYSMADETYIAQSFAFANRR